MVTIRLFQEFTNRLTHRLIKILNNPLIDYWFSTLYPLNCAVYKTIIKQIEYRLMQNVTNF